MNTPRPRHTPAALALGASLGNTDPAFVAFLGLTLDGHDYSDPPAVAGDYNRDTLSWLQLRNKAFADEIAKFALCLNLRRKIERIAHAHD